jgi:hypothetical protein
MCPPDTATEALDLGSDALTAVVEYRCDKLENSKSHLLHSPLGIVVVEVSWLHSYAPATRAGITRRYVETRAS